MCVCVRESGLELQTDPRLREHSLGVFEGHMTKMAEGFKAIRMAELELNSGGYNETEHGEFFRYFDWTRFSDEEWLLCPPVVAIGGDGAMYDIGFQNLSRLMASGKPIKARKTNWASSWNYCPI